MGLLDKFKRKERRRAVVIGLDGVPFTLLRDFKSKGYLPNMSKIFDDGYFGRMSVCIPEISSVSWSSFMTGTQSGEHGIFGFMDLEPGTYKMYFPNFTNLKASTLWNDLAKDRKKTVVINMPSTYPAREINGVMISGFVAIDINKAVHPQTEIPKLIEMGYRIDVDTTKARQDHDFLFRDLKETLDARKKAFDYFWDTVDWDLFIFVITGTDRLMHFLWDAYKDTTHKYHNAFLDYYTQVDGVVGRIYDRFLQLERSKNGANEFLMLSDHGFTGIKTEVYLNSWLRENGYLKFQKESPETIMDIGEGSTAFVLDPSRIYINLRGKYPLGVVDDTDYEKVRRELKESLEVLTYEGSRIAKKIFLKEEIYQGSYMSQAPDLVMLSHRGYDLKGRVINNSVFDRTNLAGMHTQDDAFFFSRSGVQCKTIFEAKEIILKALIS